MVTYGPREAGTATAARQMAQGAVALQKEHETPASKPSSAGPPLPVSLMPCDPHFFVEGLLPQTLPPLQVLGGGPWFSAPRWPLPAPCPARPPSSAHDLG